MKILLQNFETGLYLRPDGQWTDQPELGIDFPNTVEATEYTLRRRLPNTYVIVRTFHPQPLAPRRKRTAASASRPRAFAPRTAWAPG